MASINKEEIGKVNDNPIYIFKMPDISGLTKFKEEGKPLLEEVVKTFITMESQTRTLIKENNDIVKFFRDKIEKNLSFQKS